MNKDLKDAVAHHRSVVNHADNAAHRIPVESVTICMLAEIHDALMAKKAARAPKKAKPAK
jgi:hypothetical protein